MSKKIILITGATSGIGHEIASELSIHKTTLILVGRNKKKLKKLQATCEQKGSEAYLFTGDLSDAQSLHSMTKSIRKSFSRIDWIIHSAGMIESGKNKTLNYGQKIIQDILHVNIVAPYLLIKDLQTIFQKGTGGVLHIASTAGLRGNPRFPIYSASKAALINLTASLAKSDFFLAKSKKAINIIPGATNTPMRQKIAQDAKTKQSPTFIAQWIAKAIAKNDFPESGSSILFIDGKVSKQKSHVSKM